VKPIKGTAACNGLAIRAKKISNAPRAAVFAKVFKVFTVLTALLVELYLA
jgi:hypothetical protein